MTEPNQNPIRSRIIPWLLSLIMLIAVMVTVWKSKDMKEALNKYSRDLDKLQERQTHYSQDSITLITKLAESRRREDSLIKYITIQDQRHEKRLIYIFDSIPDSDVNRVFARTFDSLAQTRFSRFIKKTGSPGNR